MKRTIITVLAALLGIISLCSCSDNKTESTAQAASDSEDNSAVLTEISSNIYSSDATFTCDNPERIYSVDGTEYVFLAYEGFVCALGE